MEERCAGEDIFTVTPLEAAEILNSGSMKE